MAPQKGKPPTKGAKQIVAENAATVYFYRNMALGSSIFYNILTLIFFREEFTLGIILLNLLVILINLGCYKIMTYMSRPRYTENNELFDSGLDLNMEGGVGEHVKDVIILASITHVLALLSNYFWLLLVCIPIRCLWLAWVHICAPWFFQEAPQETEQDEKKRKKMERKMKRMK